MGSDVVLTWIDATNRTFWNMEPWYYYTSTDCSGTPLMYVDLTRMGFVHNGTLYYPAGPATLQQYGSTFQEGWCSAVTGTGALAPMGSRPVNQLVAPFSVVR
jgi:hypothetical protein